MKRLFLLLLAAVVPTTAGTVYFQDFESANPIPEWSGSGSVQTTGGLSAYGFGSQHWRNDTGGATTLSLTGLASHSIVNVTFDLAMWDSIDNGDTFQFSADGNFLINGGPFANYFAPGACSSGCFAGPGTLLSPEAIDFGTPQLGYNGSFRDQGRRVTFQFAHTASTLSFSWQYPNTQGGFDESFGIDNVLIESDAVTNGAAAPEPATFLLAAGALAILMKRRK